MKQKIKYLSLRFGILTSPEFGENKSPAFGQQIRPRKWDFF